MGAKLATLPQTFLGRMGVASVELEHAFRPYLLFLAVAFLVFLGKPSGDANAYSATVTAQTIWVTGFVAYGVYLVSHRKLPGPTALDWPLVVLVGAYVLACLTSVSPRLSAEASTMLGTGLIAFYAFSERDLFGVESLRRVLAGVVALVGVVGAVILVSGHLDWLEAARVTRGSTGLGELVPPALPRLPRVLDHPNVIAMILNTGLPFALTLVVLPKHRFDRTLGATAVVLGFVSLFFTQSRGAWLGTAVWLPLLLLACVAARPDRAVLGGLQQALRSRYVRIFAALCVLVLFASTAFVAAGNRPSWLFRSTLHDRFEASAVALRMVEDNPLTGVGPNGYALLYQAYGGENEEALRHAHNAYAQLLSDVGLLGLGACLLAAAAVLKTLVLGWKVSGYEGRVLIAATLAAMVGSAVHGLADTPAYWEAFILPFAVAMAIGMRQAETPWPRRGGSIRLPRLLVLGLAPAILVLWLLADGGHREYDRSLQLLDKGAIAEGATVAMKAADADPHVAAYQLHAGTSLAYQYVSRTEDGLPVDPGLLVGAEAYLRRATELDPHNPYAYSNLALVLRLRDDVTGAVEAARTSRTLSGIDGMTASIAGSIFEWAGQREEAVAAYAQAVTLEPSLAQSPFWSRSAESLSLRSEVLAATTAGPCELARFAALYRVYTDELPLLLAQCEDVIARSPMHAGRQADLALALHALGQETRAIEVAEAAKQRSPDHSSVLIASAVVLFEGDAESARYALLRSTYRGSRDGAALLAASYGRRATGEAGGAALRPAILAPDSSEVPAIIEARVRQIALRGGGSAEQAWQRHLPARLYYSLASLRQPPAVIFVPGEWQTLVPPHMLLAESSLGLP